MKLIARKLVVAALTWSTIALAQTTYANWYSCPTPESIAKGEYAPFILCSGNISNAKSLNMIYTNVFKKSTTYLGVCKYRNPNTLAEVYFKVPLHGQNDVLPSSGWNGGGGLYMCGIEANGFILPDRNPQFNVY